MNPATLPRTPSSALPRVEVKWLTQPAQLPDLNVNDLKKFAPIESRVWKEGFTTLDEIVAGVMKLFTEYDQETLERVWQHLFKRYNQVLGALGWNDFEVQHGRGVEPATVDIDKGASEKENYFGTVQPVRTTKMGNAQYVGVLPSIGNELTPFSTRLFDSLCSKFNK